MALEIGILLALACALTTNLGFLLKHRGAIAAPDVELRHPLASAVAMHLLDFVGEQTAAAARKSR